MSVASWVNGTEFITWLAAHESVKSMIGLCLRT